jgi:CheY-like chemotaxis protein
MAVILVVEDHPVNALLLRSILVTLGHQAVMALHGGEALERLQESACDLVFMDLMMPVMDGYEATRRIRAQPAWARLPIVVVTADVMNDSHQQARAAGADDVITKPYTKAQIVAALERWLPRP